MSFEWQVPIIVIGIVLGIYFFIGRPKVESDAGPVGGSDPEPDTESHRVPDGEAGPEPGEPGPEPDGESDPERTGALSGPELVDRIQQTLGIGILVDAVEPAETVTIRATFMSGQHTTQATVTADTEAEAWQELAKAAVAWRNSDYQHLPMWWGGVG